MMHNQTFWKSITREGAVLNPVDRISEVLFGLIMVLSFTGTISAATDGPDEIRELLWAALGCNLAWGLVDAIMYLMNVLLERGHNIAVIKRIARLQDGQASREVLKQEIQPLMAKLLKDEELDQLSERLKKLPGPSNQNLITMTDLRAGLQIFFLVFLCTLPVALPFAFLQNAELAMKTSNAVALSLLFIGGYLLAGYAGFSRPITALTYCLIGVLLVALTMALGG
jgi:hypothetical protein